MSLKHQRLHFALRFRKFALGILMIPLVLMSGSVLGQSMFYHLLVQNAIPIADFLLSSQTVNESAGVWSDWPVGLSAWSKRRQILAIGAATPLSNFPMMIKLDSSRISYADTQGAGQDLRFTDNAGTVLAHEIESWNPAGTSIVWVKIPTLAADPTRTLIWMYYGNAVAADGQNKTAVWDANHLGVWHLNGDANDSTSNAKTGTVTGAPFAAGISGQAVSVNGTVGNGIRLPDSMTVSNTFTVSASFKTATSGVIFGHSNLAYSATPGSWDPLLYVGTDGKLRGGDYAGGIPTTFISTATVTDNLWHTATITGNTNTQSLYLDGGLVGTYNGTLGMTGIIVNYIGMGFWNSWPASSGTWNSFNGLIDEVRVSNTARSADWVAMSHWAQVDSLPVFMLEETQNTGVAAATVQLSQAATSNVTIPFTVSGTATAGADHNLMTGNLSILAGASSGDLRARIYRDNLVEGDETIILTLGTPTNATLGTTTVHTITITDEALSPPVAVDDSYTLTNLNPVTLNVLVNDSDANGDYLQIISTTNPASGTVTRRGQTLIFTPSGDFGGTDSFTYTISDGRVATATATVTLNYQIPFTWLGAGADANWTTLANWQGGVVPGVGDKAYFNNQCTTYCNPLVVGNISVAGLQMNSSYSGTIDLQNFTITAGALGLTQRAGNWVGGTALNTVNGPLSIFGGVFTATSATTSLNGNLLINAATNFVHNSGTWFQKANTKTWTLPTSSNVSFYNLQFDATSDYLFVTFTPASTWNVLNTLTVGPSNYEYTGLINGTMNVYGNINLTGAGARGSTLVKLLGTVDQTITGNGTAHLPSVEIAKPSGTLFLVGTILVDMHFTYTTGVVDPGTSTLKFRGQDGGVSSRNLLFNGLSLNNVSFSNVNSHASLGGTTLTVLGSLAMQMNGYSVNSGTIYVKGDTTCGSSTVGSVVVIMDGAANSNVGASGAFSCLGLQVAKTGGASVNLTSNYLLNSAGQNLTVNSGIVNMAGFNLGVNSTVTVAALAKLICNGGTLTYASAVVNGEISCGAAGITWIGLAGDNLWTTAGNWTNNTVPAAADLAYFNSQCSGLNCNATINSALTVKGINLYASYVGTLTQAAGIAMTLGTSGWQQAGGTFVGSDAAIGLSGAFVLSGGAFTATSGTITINGSSNFTTSGTPVFNHNSGSLVFTSTASATNTVTAGSLVFNNVAFQGYNLSTTVSGTMTVNGTLSMADIYASGGCINTGTILAKGDISSSSVGKLGTGLVKIVGSSNQTVTGVSGATIPNFEVASTGGTVTYSGALIFSAANYTYTSGTLDTSASELVFTSTASGTNTVIPGAVNYQNVTFQGVNLVTTLTGTMTVNGTLTLGDTSSSSGSINTGTVVAKGPVTTTSYGKSGTGLLKVAGSTNQTITGVATGYLPSVEIASTGGTVSYSGSLLFSRNYTYTSGVVDAGTSTAIFNNGTLTTTLVPGTAAFNNVTFTGSSSSSHFTITGDMTVNGLLTLGCSGAYCYTDTGNILAYGDVSANNYGIVGTAVVKLVGAGNQTLSGTSTAVFPSVEIASTGGTVTLSGTTIMSRDFKYTSGTVNAATSNLIFGYSSYYSGSSFTFTPGSVTYNAVSFLGAATTYSLASGTLTALGTVTFGDTSSSTGAVNSGTINASGDIAFTNYGKSGSVVLNAVGASASNFSIATSALKVTSLVTIAKTGGAIVTMLSDLPFNGAGQDITVASGSLNMAGFDLTVPDILTVAAGASLTCNGGDLIYGSVANSGTVTCPGFAGYAYNWTGAAADGNWSTAGNWSGGAVPNSAAVVIFDSVNCGANCNATMDAAINVRGIKLNAGYSATVTQAPGVVVTLGSKGWVQAAGTFVGGDSAVTMDGPFTQSGGVYSATSSTFKLRRNIAITGGSFNAGTGSMVYSAAYNTSRALNWGTTTVNNLEFLSESGYDSWTATMTGTVTVNGNLLLTRLTGGTSGTLSGGTLSVKGNLTTSATFAGSTAIRLTGSSNQTVTGSAGSFIPNLDIASTGGTVTLTGSMILYKSFVKTSGTVVATGSDITLRGLFSTTYPLNLSSITFGNLTFICDSGADGVTFSLTSNIIANGNLTFSHVGGPACTLNGQTVLAKGNLTATGGAAWLGTTNTTLDGSAAATVTVAATTGLPKGSLAVNKTSGGVTLASALSINNAGQSLSILSGSMNMAGFALTINSTLSLSAGTTLTKSAGVLTVNSVVMPAGAYSSGTINP